MLCLFYLRTPVYIFIKLRTNKKKQGGIDILIRFFFQSRRLNKSLTDLSRVSWVWYETKTIRHCLRHSFIVSVEICFAAMLLKHGGKRGGKYIRWAGSTKTKSSVTVLFFFLERG